MIQDKPLDFYYFSVFIGNVIFIIVMQMIKDVTIMNPSDKENKLPDTVCLIFFKAIHKTSRADA